MAAYEPRRCLFCLLSYCANVMFAGIVPPSIPDVEATGVQRAHALMDPTPMTLLDNPPRNTIVVGTVDFVNSGDDVTVRYFFTGTFADS